MITEDYVSFETAKLLKDKGFLKGVDLRFTQNLSYYDSIGLHHNLNKYYNSLILDKIDFVVAPTLQMAMKWLREDKKILISIFCHIDKGYWFCIQHFIESPYKFATSDSIHRKEEILGKIQYYETYEQATEAAIKYCLEHLI